MITFQYFFGKWFALPGKMSVSALGYPVQNLYVWKSKKTKKKLSRDPGNLSNGSWTSSLMVLGQKTPGQ